MTLRDLTKRQLYNLRRRCEKHFNQTCNNERKTGKLMSNKDFWNTAFNQGLKAGLEII